MSLHGTLFGLTPTRALTVCAMRACSCSRVSSPGQLSLSC